MEFLQICSSMLTIVAMVAVGVVLTKIGWINEQVKDFLIKITVQLALPTLMFESVITDFTREEIIAMKSRILIPFASILLTMAVGIAMAYILHVDPKKRGLFISMFFNSNTIFVGLPVNLALNGKSCIPDVMLYYMASTCLFWTLGVYFISLDGESGEKRRFFSKDTLKNICSLPLISFLLALAWIMTGWEMPKPVLTVLGYFGNLTTPLSMLFIGSCICCVSVEKMKPTREIIGVLVGRCVAAPCIMLTLLHFSAIEPKMGRVFLVQAAMPVMTNTAILARAYHCDEDYAAVMTVLTTLMVVLVVPVYCIIFDHIF